MSSRSGREHVDAEIKVCPDCATETRGTFPDTMPGPLQYGLGIIAFAVHMLAAQMVPLKRTAQVLKTITGRSIAEATLLSWVLAPACGTGRVGGGGDRADTRRAGHARR